MTNLKVVIFEGDLHIKREIDPRISCQLHSKAICVWVGHLVVIMIQWAYRIDICCYQRSLREL